MATAQQLPAAAGGAAGGAVRGAAESAADRAADAIPRGWRFFRFASPQLALAMLGLPIVMMRQG